jgi:hypothetical protein
MEAVAPVFIVFSLERQARVWARNQNARTHGLFQKDPERESRAGWRELDDTEAVVESDVGVETPTESRVERFGAVNI